MTEVDDIATGKRVLAIEAAALAAAADGLGAAFAAAISRILAAKGRVICAGLGKSGHVARKIAATFSSTGTPAYYVHPSEASHGDLGAIQPDDVILVLSRSGETAELDDIVHYARRFGVGLIAVTAAPNSALAAAAEISLVIPDAPEACAETNAPTTSTTVMMALGDALAVALLQRRGFDASRFKVFHPGGRLGAMLKTASDLMKHGADTPLVGRNAAIEAVVAEISAKGLGCAGVIDDAGALVGVVTDGDLRRYIAGGRKGATAEAVMTRAPVAVSPETLAADVVQIMNERKITQVFVVERSRPVGVVHLHDALKAGVA